MFPGQGFDSNVFLLTGDEPILVDAGTGAYAERTLRAITKALGKDRVSHLVLTHRHFDHVGGAAALSAALGAKVLIHELDAPPVREGSARGTEAIMFGESLAPLDVEELRGGEVLSTGEHELQVIHTPGHTAGGISLFDARSKALLSGDTVFAGGVGRWDLSTGNHGDLVASVKKLQALGAVDLYPGHGPSARGNAGEQIVEALRYLGEY
ncbi:MBL fold metallo-hydrolase [Methanomassiliicoccus luminyensis]|nr:MBL fold metallo-hydrolase [Methanomassiliicoccus luminyensis]